MNTTEVIEKIKFLAQIVKLRTNRKLRNLKSINQEYDVVWSQIDETLEFDAHLTGYRDDPDDTALILDHGKFIKTQYKEYYNEYTNQFLKYIKKYSERNFPIVELGCGVGSKLFVLAKNGFSNLTGYDLTEAGINIAKRYNDKKQYNVNFEIVDLTKKIPDLTGKTIFTVSCLEQLKNYMPKVLKNIINANPNLVINFEVDYNNAPYLVKKYFDAVDYQNNLVSELEKMPVTIVHKEELPLQLSFVNPLSIIVWKPNNEKN